MKLFSKKQKQATVEAEPELTPEEEDAKFFAEIREAWRNEDGSKPFWGKDWHPDDPPKET